MTERDDQETPSPEAPGPGDAAPVEEVETRWWIDTGRTGGRGRTQVKREIPEERVLGESIFAVGEGFDEDRARDHLTDTNLTLIREANPAPGEWAYLAPVDSRSNDEKIAKTKKFLQLPPHALGVLVDSGNAIRAIATGDPPGERVVELRLGKESSLDAWIEGDWVQERVFRDRYRALREGTRLIARHLGPPRNG